MKLRPTVMLMKYIRGGSLRPSIAHHVRASREAHLVGHAQFCYSHGERPEFAKYAFESYASQRVKVAGYRQDPMRLQGDFRFAQQ